MAYEARRYNNESERLKAIEQFEKEGAKEWESNAKNRTSSDNCIVINEEGTWYDDIFHEKCHEEIFLDPPEQPEKITLKESLELIMLCPLNASPHTKFVESIGEAVEFAANLQKSFNKKAQELLTPKK